MTWNGQRCRTGGDWGPGGGGAADQTSAGLLRGRFLCVFSRLVFVRLSWDQFKKNKKGGLSFFRRYLGCAAFAHTLFNHPIEQIVTSGSMLTVSRLREIYLIKRNLTKVLNSFNTRPFKSPNQHIIECYFKTVLETPKAEVRGLSERTQPRLSV